MCPESFKVVSRKSQKSFKAVSMVFQENLSLTQVKGNSREFSKVFPVFFKKVSSVFQVSFQGVSRMFKRCFKED